MPTVIVSIVVITYAVSTYDLSTYDLWSVNCSNVVKVYDSSKVSQPAPARPQPAQTEAKKKTKMKRIESKQAAGRKGKHESMEQTDLKFQIESKQEAEL